VARLSKQKQETFHEKISNIKLSFDDSLIGHLQLQQDDSSQIKIGVIAELTGDVPAVGASAKNAAEMPCRKSQRCRRHSVGDTEIKIN